MIFEQELKDKGFEIKDNQLYYEFSDFELLRARVSDGIALMVLKL